MRLNVQRQSSPQANQPTYEEAIYFYFSILSETTCIGFSCGLVSCGSDVGSVTVGWLVVLACGIDGEFLWDSNFVLDTLKDSLGDRRQMKTKAWQNIAGSSKPTQ